MEPVTTALGLGIYAGGELLGALMNYFGANKQAEENRRTREENKRMFNTQLGFEREKWGQELALGQRQQTLAEQREAFGQKTTTQQLASQEEEKQFSRKGFLMNGFMAMINSSPAIRQNLINTWRQ